MTWQWRQRPVAVGLELAQDDFLDARRLQVGRAAGGNAVDFETERFIDCFPSKKLFAQQAGGAEQGGAVVAGSWNAACIQLQLFLQPACQR